MAFDETTEGSTSSIEGDNNETFIPSLSEDVIDKFGGENGRFKKVEFNGENIYLEKSKKGAFYPESRFFIFPKFVISIDTPEISELFAINSRDADFLKEIKTIVSDESNFIEDQKGRLFTNKTIKGSVHTIVYYRDTRPEDRQEVMKELRIRNMKDI
jgi:hypothetical protein